MNHDKLEECDETNNEPASKPTIWGWFIPTIYANKRDWFILGFTTLQTQTLLFG